MALASSLPIFVLDDAGVPLGRLNLRLSAAIVQGTERGISYPALIRVQGQQPFTLLLARMGTQEGGFIEPAFAAHAQEKLLGPLLRNYCERGIAPFAPLDNQPKQS